VTQVVHTSGLCGGVLPDLQGLDWNDSEEKKTNKGKTINDDVWGHIYIPAYLCDIMGAQPAPVTAALCGRLLAECSLPLAKRFANTTGLSSEGLP
jgi:hypothetical protein